MLAVLSPWNLPRPQCLGFPLISLGIQSYKPDEFLWWHMVMPLNISHGANIVVVAASAADTTCRTRRASQWLCEKSVSVIPCCIEFHLKGTDNKAMPEALHIINVLCSCEQPLNIFRKLCKAPACDCTCLKCYQSIVLFLFVYYFLCIFSSRLYGLPRPNAGSTVPIFIWNTYSIQGAQEFLWELAFPIKTFFFTQTF